MTGSPRDKFGRLPVHANQRDVDQALHDLRTLWDPTPRQRAERRFDRAKAEYTAATEALIRRDDGAAERADAALEELTAARAALRMLDDGEGGGSNLREGDGF